ncbi:tetratricopeptide repeat protein [Corynebacterium urealyticum]|uniref:Tetratricopeptide repeat protein n=1 Tax=Corynebacterium urealyticum TaxID=43771 RepID=A0A5D4G0W7_9CORY|nr:tetratricopeptide repeat protein [Corynebacterium urealyticum]TYR20200.1 tetratricopeptide repeat protein [Corynebacterium urealyticum]
MSEYQSRGDRGHRPRNQRDGNFKPRRHRNSDDNRRGNNRDRDFDRGEHRGGNRYRDRDDRRDNRYRDRDDRRDGRYNDRDGDQPRGRRGGGRPYGGGKKFDRDRRKGGDRRGGNFRNRGGQANRARQSGPQRSGYREERINARMKEPRIPEGVDPKDLDPQVRQELRSLSRDNADMVAKHLIMAATLLDENTDKALEHARAAKDRAGRVAVARETNGIAAYHAGEWKEAISELRAARRMQGGPGLIAVLADAERALGRPEKALGVAGEYRPEELDPETRVELAMVVAGAYQDLGRHEEAIVALEEELDAADAPDVTKLRVTYAYADALAQAGRTADAVQWFTNANELDTEEVLDSEKRIADLNEGTGEKKTEEAGESNGNDAGAESSEDK